MSSNWTYRALRQALRVIWQAGSDLLTDAGPQWAAAIAYYSLLSVFPLALAAMAIAAYFVDPRWAIGEATTRLGGLLPAGGRWLREIVIEVIDARGSIGGLSFLALLWSGSRVFGSVSKALNIAHTTSEPYGFIQRTLREILLMATLGVLFLVALLAGPLVTLLWAGLALPGDAGSAVGLVEAAVQPALLLLAFFITYRLVPRGPTRTRAALAGAVVATLLVVAVRPVFFSYVDDFGRYNLVYGSVAAMIVFMLWTYLLALILLYGGEIAAHVQAMLLEGRPAEEVAAEHHSRAPADPGQERAADEGAQPAAPAARHRPRGATRMRALTRRILRARGDGGGSRGGPALLAALAFAIGATAATALWHWRSSR